MREVLDDWYHMFWVAQPEAKKVILRGMWPPINLMDGSLQRLEECVSVLMPLKVVLYNEICRSTEYHNLLTGS